MQTALHSLKSRKPHEVIQIMRTWYNSWATTHRFKEELRLPCLFGCLGKPDSLPHYASCPRIRYLMSLMLGVPTWWPGFGDLGTRDPNEIALKNVSCMYYAYHAVRFSSSQYVYETYTHIPGDSSESQQLFSTTLSVKSDDSARCFLGAYRASALMADLMVQSVSFPLLASLGDFPSHASCPVPPLPTGEEIPAPRPPQGGCPIMPFGQSCTLRCASLAIYIYIYICTYKLMYIYIYIYIIR